MSSTRDDGQISLLVLVYALVATVLVLVVGAATQVHLAREQLLALADAAALDAADALDEPAYYAAGAWPGAGVPLTDASVGASASAYLAEVGAPAAMGGVSVTAGTPDGATAEVTLAARVRPGLLPASIGGWSTGVPVRVTSRARAGLVEP